MTYKLGSSITLEKSAGTEKFEGPTSSKQFSEGLRTEWRLGVKGRPDLFIHDMRWETGEREIVISRPAEVPPMPKPLSTLLGKKRATVERGALLRMAVYLVLPDDNGWPKQRHCGTEEMSAVCGEDLVGSVYDHGVITIDTREMILRDESRQRNRLCALLDPLKESGPIALYTVTRVVPTLKRVGWL